MTKTLKTLVFFGNERLVSGLQSTDAPILRALIDSGYSIAAVVSHHSETKSRNNRRLEVAELAKKHNIPVLLPNNPVEILDQLKSLNAAAAILVAYGRIIPQSVIDVFPKGIINIHPSLLPKYRGSTPLESAIMNGDHQTGVSLMALNAAMDEGPIYAQRVVSVSGTENKFDLYTAIAQESVQLLLKELPNILDGTLVSKPQASEGVSYSNQLSKNDSSLDTDAYTAIECERRIRAFLGFPKTKLTVLGHSVVITKAHIAAEKQTALDIECKDGSVLSIDELIGPSGRTMSAKAFLNGYAAG